MKKLLIILLTFAALAILCSYIFIPSKIKISSISTGQVNSVAAHRVLMDDDTWIKWWPNEKAFQLRETSFRLTQKMLNSFELMICKGGDSILSQVQIIPVNFDSVTLIWSSEIQTGNNPVKRFGHYNTAVKIKKDLDLLLDSLASFLSAPKNIYGFVVKKTIVTDSVLISTRKLFDHYPDEFETGELVKRLRAYISANNAKEMNYPMLHIRKVDSIHFEAMTAIATSIKLPDNNEFASKMVFKGGNLLEGEIIGGYATIRNALIEYENYIKDYEWTSPAIPYELIITDRTKERDTAKWITRLCYPVF